MDILRTLILIIAVIVIIKALFCLIAPASAQRTVDWWIQIPSGIARQLGVLMILLGLVLVGLAVWQMGNAVVAGITIFGTISVLSGLLYFQPAVLRAVAKPFSSNGRLWEIRVLGGVLLFVAIVLLIIYIRAA